MDVLLSLSRVMSDGYYRRMPLSDHGRYLYRPITERPDYSWPGGRRLAVYVALNLEHFAFGEGLGAELAPGGPHPDVLNYAWRDYGNRVGVWLTRPGKIAAHIESLPPGIVPPA